MISDAVATTLITVSGSLLAVYITYRVKNSKPKSDRIDTAFDAYEKIMKRQDEENNELRERNRVLEMQRSEDKRIE